MKLKKIILIILILILIPVIGFKVYLEIDNTGFAKQMEHMNNETLNTRVKSMVQHKTLNMGDYAVHYYVSGIEHKEAILFLHPAFSDHRAFDLQIDYFSKQYKVLTIDLLGHGLSKANASKDKIDKSAQHIKQILDTENIDKVHIVGVSIGALIAQYFALEHPENIKTLTALGGYNINKTNKEIGKTQRAANVSLILRAVFSMKAFRKKAAQISCATPQGQMLFYKSASHYERKSFIAMQGLQNIVKDRTLVPPSYPTLILTGASDIDLAKKMAQEWHTELKNSTYHSIDHAGHCANMDNSLIFNKIVKEFIDNKLIR